mgnify:CR=1 FL=1
MASFLNISAGQTKTDTGLRVEVSPDGERVWMHGKWLDLGPDHAVIWIDGAVKFRRPDGKTLGVGEFPAWSVRSSRRGGALALMFNASQFRGGSVEMKAGRATKRFAL